NSFEENLIKLSDDQLKAKTNEFKARLKNGETLNRLLPEAFAVVREAFLRLSGKRIYGVQMLGGVVIHQKKVAEIKTGEGKTFVAMLTAYLRVLSGQKVHIITHNQYLSTRDFKKTESLYQFLGVTVSLRKNTRKRKILSKFYEAEILFTTIESGFDLMAEIIPPSLLRSAFAIIDEADYSLIDLNNNALTFVRREGANGKYFKIIKEISEKMKQGKHYKIEFKSLVLLTEAGEKFIAEFLERSYYPWLKGHESDTELLIQTYLAVGMRYQKGIDYLIHGGQVIPIDEFTGRLKEMHRFGLYVHQLIELKEGMKVSGDEHFLMLPAPVFFDYYNEKGGMTGTIDFPVARRELSRIYGISDIVVIPTKFPSLRTDLSPKVFLDERKRDLSLVRRIEELRAQGNPVLLITQSVAESERLERLLKERKLPCEVLNAENEREENKIIHRAGGRGQITISTNMSGRGTDIVISEQVAEKGGLAVLITFRSDISPRLDYQGMGRAARQGQQGSTQFFLYLDPALYGFKKGDFRMRKQGDIDLGRHPDVLGFIDKKQMLDEEATFKHHLMQFMLAYGFYLQERFKQTFENLISDFCRNYYSQNDRPYNGIYSLDVRESLASAWEGFLYIRQLCLTYVDTQIYTEKEYKEFNDVMYKILKEKLFEAKHIKKILAKNKELDEKSQEAWKEMTEHFVKIESRILKDIKFPDKPPDKIRLEYRYREVSSPLGEKGVVLGIRCKSFADTLIFKELPITMIE
ncbi:MAG TPA: hypothetical protein DCL49_02200, partial [Candidatus Omnitrophica bacterium]|nr:hypothetical protein [Candidatus Omnitrophota bacterium]